MLGITLSLSSNTLISSTPGDPWGGEPGATDIKVLTCIDSRLVGAIFTYTGIVNGFPLWENNEYANVFQIHSTAIIHTWSLSGSFDNEGDDFYSLDGDTNVLPYPSKTAWDVVLTLAYHI